MEKNTKVVIIIAILAVAAGAWYYSSVVSKESISYDYEWSKYSYYKDSEGIHYPSSGNVFAYVHITEINTGNKDVLALPNCFTFVDSDGKQYEWTTGSTDRTTLYKGETAHILSIYEIPSSVSSGYVMCNMMWVDAKLVDL